MKTNKVCRRPFTMAMVLAAVFALAAAWPCTATAAGAPECSIIGTWSGDAGNSLRWLGIHTPGSTIIRGEMALNWVRVLDSLLKVADPQTSSNYLYPDATILTEGHGVWEMTGRNKYNYTWYAYGLKLMNTRAIYSVRVSGLAFNEGGETSNPCDRMTIYFTYEVFDGFLAPHEMSDAVPAATIQAGAKEIRVPLNVETWAPTF